MNFLAGLETVDEVAEFRLELELEQAREIDPDPTRDFTDDWLAELFAVPTGKGQHVPARMDLVTEAWTRIQGGTRRRYVDESRETYLERVIRSLASVERRSHARERLRVVKAHPDRYAVPMFDEDGDMIEDDAEAVDRSAPMPDEEAHSVRVVREFLEAAEADPDVAAVLRAKLQDRRMPFDGGKKRRCLRRLEEIAKKLR